MVSTTPILSHTSTGDDVLRALGHPDLAGQVAVVTGANSGLGLETARVLASAGAHVVLACRSKTAGADALAALKKAAPGASAELWQLDLGNQKQIRDAVAQRFGGPDAVVDILINNAGVMACPLSYTADGFEMQFGTNHLGHFALVKHLLPALQRSKAGGRVVNLSSLGHWGCQTGSGILFNDLDAKKHYDEWQRYGHAKLANILHAKELARRYPGVTAVAVHPGGIQTGLARHITAMSMLRFFKNWRMWPRIFEFGAKTIPQGCATSVFAALAPRDAKRGDGLAVTSGEYYSDCHIETYYVDSRHVEDPVMAAKLWDVSEQLVAKALAA